MAEPILQVTGITKSFGKLTAVKDLTFSVQQGEIVGVVGPNGAGKTTAFACVSGFYRLDRGRVLLRGRDVTNLPPNQIAHLGLMRTFQIVRPFDDMSVLDNVTVGAFLRHGSTGKARSKAEQVLTSLGMADRMRVPAYTLTLPDRKLLEVAKVLAGDPAVVLLDEVMAGLNPSEVTTMVERVRRVRESGVTIVMIEHVMRAVMMLCERVLVMAAGEKIAEGTTQEVTRDSRVIEAYLGGHRDATA